ncbi:C40 family peptidase [Streptomyces sp. NPDC007251]|uniref:C40 family peptidase n=1 Tax=unclassified Streptomyces TaxID=2593676 RepID=UPI0033E3D71B
MTAVSDAQGSSVQELGPFPGVTRPGRTSPGTSKAANQRKLAAASDVLSRYTARLTTSTAAAHAASVTAAAPPQSMPAPPAPVTDVPPASITAQPTFTAATPNPVTAATAPPAPVTAAPPASVMAPPPPPFSAVPPTSAIAAPPPAVAAVPATPPQPAPAPATGQWPKSQWAAAAVPDPRTTPDAMASVTGTGSLPPVAESLQASRAAKAIAFARAQIGKPCVWGATGPDSYDCSSLTQAAWRAAGVELPRAAYQQALAGAPVALAGIEPGDLVLFFDDDRHVGLHVGGGMMVHAPGPGASIREESIYGAGESAIHRIVRPA